MPMNPIAAGSYFLAALLFMEAGAWPKKDGGEWLMAERLRGTVRWFNPAKGYGFIGSEDGDEVFVHSSAIKTEGAHYLQTGQLVEFSLESTPKGRQAGDVVLLSQDRPSQPEVAPHPSRR
jgi:CspA family cold shock protein